MIKSKELNEEKTEVKSINLKKSILYDKSGLNFNSITFIEELNYDLFFVSSSDMEIFALIYNDNSKIKICIDIDNGFSYSAIKISKLTTIKKLDEIFFDFTFNQIQENVSKFSQEIMKQILLLQSIIGSVVLIILCPENLYKEIELEINLYIEKIKNNSKTDFDKVKVFVKQKIDLIKTIWKYLDFFE